MILKDILAFGIVVYVVLDCFDLRVGIRYQAGTPSPHLR
jgi:cytochrome bd-type quinol oxidase subunit 2